MKRVFLPFYVQYFEKTGKYLISNRFGGWTLLDDISQFRLGDIDQLDPFLLEKLERRGIVISEANLDDITGRFRSLNSHLFSDVGLHIAVLTTECNFDCVYCQARSNEKRRMGLEVAAHILKFLFDSRRYSVSLEFQGGEPLLNWETLKFMVEKAREWNNGTKDLEISLVTNGSLLDEEKVDFLKEKGVGICVSYDGPSQVHDFNRRYVDGRPTHDVVRKAIDLLQRRSASVSLITTISRESLKYWKEIIDSYVDMGIKTIAFRPLSKINVDPETWQKIGYSLDEFMSVYEKAVRYMLNLNRSGITIKERMMSNVAQKILYYSDPSYVDMCCPCGAGRNVLAYMPNGDVYTCDEARMLEDRDMFRIGNVLKDDYKDVLAHDTVIGMATASCLDIVDPSNPFIAWTGTCPVYTYQETGSILGHSSMLEFHNAVIRLFFCLYEEYEEELQAWGMQRIG